MMQLSDSPLKYGGISRCFHSITASLIGWQLFTVAMKMIAPDAPITDAIWSSHQAIGVLLLVLVVLRVAWALKNRPNRPPSVSVLSRIGHVTLYVMMLAIPVVALIRSYGSGRGVDIFGVTILGSHSGEEIEWMTQIGNSFHGEAAWALLVLILGHMAMPAIHARRARNKKITKRMIG